MNEKAILHQFLINANISAYEGTIKSLVEMIYWGTSEPITADRLADFMIENRYLGKYRLNLAKTNGQTLVRISKCSHGTCPTPEESLAEFPGLQRKQI